MTTGVYIARDIDGVVLYVGSSIDIEKRLDQHRSGRSPWWGLAASIEEIPVETRHLAMSVEREKILELNPTHNIMSKAPAKVASRATGPVVKPRTDALARVINSYGTVAKLATAVGVNHMTMSDIWRGVSFPSSKVIARLMVVTGHSFDELFAVDTVGGSTDPEDWREPKRAPRKPRIVRDEDAA